MKLLCLNCKENTVQGRRSLCDACRKRNKQAGMPPFVSVRRVWAAIEANPHASSCELAALLGWSKSYISRAIGELERLHVVARSGHRHYLLQSYRGWFEG